MPSVTAMGMASSAALTRMRIVMAGENEGKNERLNRRAAEGERASVVEGRWNGAAEQDLAMVFVGIVGLEGRGFRLSREKERRVRRQSVRSAIRGRFVQVPAHVHVPGAWGACTPGTMPVRARTAVLSAVRCQLQCTTSGRRGRALAG